MRIVYVTPQTPFAAVSGGAMRIAALAQVLGRLGEVVVVVVGERPPVEVRRQVRAAGGWVLPSRPETTARRACRILREAARGRAIPAGRYLSPRRVHRLTTRVAALRPDVVILGDPYLADAFGPALRPIAPRLVVDLHDAASRVHLRIAAASRSLLAKGAYHLLAANTRRVERVALARADQLWTASEEDARFYRESYGHRDVVVVPNVVAFPPDAPEGEEPGRVVFTGSYSYWPNEDAALRLADLAPRLSAAGVLRRLLLVGIQPTDRMFAAAAGHPEIEITGRVPKVEPYLDPAAVFAAPLSAGSGTKLKILEAMARGRPVLTTPIGAEGLGLEPSVHAEVVALPRFEQALDALLRDPARRAALGRAGREWAMRRYSLDALEARLRALLPGA
jgi:glycosyltransferase involved in cell wall biosynthesis